MEENRALTAEEVAKKLKIAKNTVYELIKRGELRSYKVGRKVRVDLVDLNNYIKQSKQESFNTQETQREQNLSHISTSNVNYNIFNNPNISSAFIISGQDILLDILANMLQNHPEGVQTLRSYVGSFSGLLSLYYDQCQIAAIHLYDGENEVYNVPYVRRMVPGIPCVIINLAKRIQGFYVKKDNPKKIKSWVCLTRDDISFINREKGSGTRVLLDEMLKKYSINPNEITGYYNERTSHIAIVNAIANSKADVGIGCKDAAMNTKNIEFIPLYTESYDLVIKKENLNDPTYKLVYDILCSDEFINSINKIGTYDLSNLGQIVAET